MATYIDPQKRKRADSILDCITVLTAADIAANPTLNNKTDDKHYGLPSNVDLDSDESNVD